MSIPSSKPPNGIHRSEGCGEVSWPRLAVLACSPAPALHGKFRPRALATASRTVHPCSGAWTTDARHALHRARRGSIFRLRVASKAVLGSWLFRVVRLAMRWSNTTHALHSRFPGSTINRARKKALFLALFSQSRKKVGFLDQQHLFFKEIEVTCPRKVTDFRYMTVFPRPATPSLKWPPSVSCSRVCGS